MTRFAPDQLVGRTALDPGGDKVGKVGQVYLDDQTGQPAWVTVSTGLFGNRQSFAPLQGASTDGEEVLLAVTKDQVKDAPNVEDDGHLNEDEQRALYDYYGGILGAGSHGDDGGQPEAGRVGGPGRDVSGRNTDSAMTRSEERLRVGTEKVETGRARLRKYVVTENVTQTVPVSHEEVRVEREPITEENVGAATEGPDISEEEHEVTLHAERPVVGRETVPVERVRMDTETVAEQQQVDDTVRKEHIEVEGDGNAAR
jgi:uncharacterized protein (TIGR02271 family)